MLLDDVTDLSPYQNRNYPDYRLPPSGVAAGKTKTMPDSSLTGQQPCH
jgi:hypothetical protein